MITKDQKRRLKTLVSHYMRESVKLSWAGSYSTIDRKEAVHSENVARQRLNAFIESITEEDTCK